MSSNNFLSGSSCDSLFPVDSMILLGSIDRSELHALCDWWLSAERRIFRQEQCLQEQNQYAKDSWESFAFVDEDDEESGDKVCQTERVNVHKESKTHS